MKLGSLNDLMLIVFPSNRKSLMVFRLPLIKISPEELKFLKKTLGFVFSDLKKHR